MKFLTITIILFFLNTSVFAQIVNEETAFFNYNYDKNLVKTNKIETITIETFFSDGKSLGKVIDYFDSEGLLTRQTSLDSAEGLKNEFLFTADAHKELILRINKNYPDNKIDTVFYFKSYNRDKLIRDSSSNMPFSSNFEYSNNGHLLKTILNSSLGGYTTRVILNKLDSLGRVINITETRYENGNSLTGMQLSNRDILYNNNGKIEKEVEKLNGTYSWVANKGSINYTYDKNGNLTEILRTNAASYNYKYNDKGLITNTKMSVKFDDDSDMIETYQKYTYTFRQ